MKTDNKTMNKTEYAEMVRGSIDSRILSEAANHTFEKRSSRVATWAAAACFTLIFAAAAILLIKPMTERGQAAKGTPAPEATKTAQTTPDACFTPVPTPDISNMRIIYGRADCIAINDVQHKTGTVTLYGGLREMLADEQYDNCIFAVDINIQDSYPYSYLYNDPSEESDGLYAEYQNDPAVMRYNELYENFVRENADRYDEFLARYHPSLSSFYSGYPTRDVEDAVFSSAFRNHLTSTGQEQFLYDYSKAERKYYSKLSQARNEAEVQRLRSLGLIVEEYKAYEHPLDSSLSSVYIEPECRIYPNMWLRCLLTRDQLLNFPASPEFAYIITPAVKGDDTPDSTEVPDSLAIDEAQAEHIINLLAEYHAAQFTRSAQIGELKLSENVLSDLEERQRCIDETEERIGQLNYANATVNRLYIAPYYEINGDFKCFTVLYYELVNTNYCSDLQYDFLIRHTVTVAPDGTVLSDIFSEKNTTGFSNTPLGGETLEYYPITSDHYDYLAAANALLAGEAPERTDFSCGQQYVFFRFTDDGLMAYDVAYGNDDYEFLFGDPIAVFPREVSELAYRRLNEYYDRYVSVSDHSAGPDPIYQGFIGENWFALVTLDDSMQDLQVHCIFYFDGSEWREIIGNNGGVYINGEGTPFPHTIFGACVLDEDTAIICYYTKWFFTEGSDDGKLYIYRTENGGESWGRLDIDLPDYYINMDYYVPLTPIFDESGQHGVIIFDSGIMANGESAPFGWLESLDGGVSWEFRSLEG